MSESVLETPVTTSQSMCVMGYAGDVVITWDERNKDAVIEYARKKMEEGYTFYVLKPKKVFGVMRDEARHKVTEDNFEAVIKGSKGIVVPDDALTELMAASQDQGVTVKRRTRDQEEMAIAPGSRLKNPEEVVGKDTVGMRPLVGG